MFPIWYHNLTHQESQAQTHAGISACNIDLWVDWSLTFLPHSAGIWWSFEGWIWWSFPGHGSKTPMAFILLEGTNVGLVEVRQCGWKIWRWGQLRSPHDSGKENRSGYVCSSMLTRTNIRIIYNGPAFSHQIGIILCACVATSCLVRILQADHPRRNLDIWPPAARNVMWIHWSYCLRGSISSVGCLAKIHKDFHLGCC